MEYLQPKFDYKKLEKATVEGKRKYQTPDGKAVASVTTILGATADKTALYDWQKRVGKKKAQEVVNEAGGIGTRLHKYIEDYILSGDWVRPGSNPHAKKAHAMATVIKNRALCDVTEIWGSEVALYMPHLYAGTTDLVGCYKDNPAIMDFKQANKPKKPEWVEDYYLQLVLYGMAHNELYGTNIKEGHVFMCARNNTLEPGNEEYQQFDIWPDEWDDWCHEAWNRVYRYYESQL